jgi:hypothetical protein
MRRTFFWTGLSMWLLAAFQIPCVAQAADSLKTQLHVPAQYSAAAFGQAGTVAGRSFGLSVYVQELTSDGEVQELAATLKHKGQDGLLSALEDIKDKGRVALTGSVGTLAIRRSFRNRHDRGPERIAGQFFIGRRTASRDLHLTVNQTSRDP